MDKTCAASCRCIDAVKRAYAELRARDVPDRAAFEAATSVYRAHHPEASLRDARFTIAAWLDPED